MKWYYYLHTNGDLIGKNPIVVTDDYFDSPFVKEVWEIDTTNRGDAWTLVLEALALGANIDRVKELVNKWNLDLNDSFEMLIRLNPNERMKNGLEIFVNKILNMNIDDYFNQFKLYCENH